MDEFCFDSYIRDFLESSKRLLFMVDSNGLILSANDELLKIIDFTASEINGKHLKNFVHNEDNDVIDNILECNPSHTILIRLLKKNGSYLRVECQVLMHNNIICISAKNIDEDEKFRQTLKENEERNKLITSLTVSYTFKFLVKENNKIELVYTSENIEKITGRTSKEASNIEKWSEIFHPDDYEKVMKFLQNLMTNNMSDEIECRTFVKGKYRWVNIIAMPEKDPVNGRTISITGAVKDITDRKVAEEALQQSEQRFSDIFNLTPSIIGISRQSDDIILDGNQEITVICGFERDEFVGKTTQDLKLWVHPEERANLVTIMREKGEVRNFEFKMRTKYGNILTCIISAKKHIHNNEPCFLWVINDITDRKIKEDQVQDALNRAERSDKLKEAFLQNLSHEIRTPLNSIVGFSDLISKDDRPLEEIKKFATIISNNSIQLLSIVTDVLTIASIQTGQVKINLKNVDVNKMFDQLGEIFSPLAKTRELKFLYSKEVTSGPLVIRTDEIKLNQILTNLINNAFKFTNRGSIEIRYSIQNNLINFFVKDTGIGISKEAQKIIFERFMQAEHSISVQYGGTGLGLSISKSFAQMLGGDIKVISEPELGSEFILSLPYIPVIVKPEIKESKLYLPGAKFNILIAEDELDNFLFLEAALSSDNIKILHARNGSEVLNLVKEYKNIDIILMDLKMPGMDGINAFKELRKINNEIPVIAQTAYAIAYEKQQLLDLGFNEFISKPINSTELFEKINKLITLQKQ